MLTTRHDKQRALGGPLAEAGIDLVVAGGIDTDRLGTFTGEVERPGDMLATAIAKARLGMEATGLPLGVASEGSFGPHPAAPFIPAGLELLVLVDDVRGIVVREHRLEEETNFSHTVAAPGDDLGPWLAKVGFPSHAVIVRPNTAGAGQVIEKGLSDERAVEAAVARAARASGDALARVETDMRAHHNPTRMRSLELLARAFATRLATPCPACGTWGWGRSDVVRGLPCAWCGLPTDNVRFERWSCAACDHIEDRPRSDGLLEADPARCGHCNP